MFDFVKVIRSNHRESIVTCFPLAATARTFADSNRWGFRVEIFTPTFAGRRRSLNAHRVPRTNYNSKINGEFY